MPAVSKKQQRFFGMVRAAQKGEGASSPEVAKVADEISDKDAKKFAKTKHKGLPEKKKMKESFTPHKMINPSTKKEYWADTEEKHLKYKKMGYVHDEKEIKESVLDVVRKFSKKKKEKEAQKAQDAGARARRALQRKEYASKVSGSTDNVPDNLRDSLQILKRLIK